MFIIACIVVANKFVLKKKEICQKTVFFDFMILSIQEV